MFHFKEITHGTLVHEYRRIYSYGWSSRRCVILVLGLLFLKEFTRPGVTVEPGTPQWGSWTFPESAAEPPTALQHAVTFPSADGALLRGEFWEQAQSTPTIIISHGFHFPSVHFRSVAALEYAHGANILLFDYRGHGESVLIPTTCGNAEINDLVAAVNVAASQPQTSRGASFQLPYPCTDPPDVPGGTTSISRALSLFAAGAP